MVRSILLAALLLPLAMAMPAEAACRAPSAPGCVAGKGAFPSDDEETACKATLDAYLAGTKSYNACLVDALKAETAALVARAKRRPHAEDYVAEVTAAADRADREGKAAIARYNAAADAFNAKVNATSLKRLKDAGVTL